MCVFQECLCYFYYGMVMHMYIWFIVHSIRGQEYAYKKHVYICMYLSICICLIIYETMKKNCFQPTFLNCCHDKFQGTYICMYNEDLQHNSK